MKEALPAETELTAQQYADDYLEGLELIGEDAEGREGYYTPNERELWIATDAVNGLIADEEFCALIAKEHAARRAEREAEGRCPGCGCPKAEGHWGRQCKG
jgi:hypothetical protein